MREHILTLIFLTAYCAGIPVTSSTVDSNPPSPTSIEVVPKKRSQFDIVWACLSTLLICTWRTVHPNVPPPNIRPFHQLLRRIQLMFWTLLVPELVLIWAAKQWLAAMYIAEYFQKMGWTTMHGHFLGMGGFTLKREKAKQMEPLEEPPEEPPEEPSEEPVAPKKPVRDLQLVNDDDMVKFCYHVKKLTSEYWAQKDSQSQARKNAEKAHWTSSFKCWEEEREKLQKERKEQLPEDVPQNRKQERRYRIDSLGVREEEQGEDCKQECLDELTLWRMEIQNWEELLRRCNQDDAECLHWKEMETELGYWEEELKHWEREVKIRERWENRKKSREILSKLRENRAEQQDHGAPNPREVYKEGLQKIYDHAQVSLDELQENWRKAFECNRVITIRNMDMDRWRLLKESSTQRSVLREVMEDVKKAWKGLREAPLELFEEKLKTFGEALDRFQAHRRRKFYCDVDEKFYSGENLEPGALSFSRFRALLLSSRISFPSITEGEIKDRSKRDPLSKVIFIFQVTWFLLQCTARRWQHIALTELELVTLAIASLNIGICLFWLSKPLDVREPVPVYLRGHEPVGQIFRRDDLTRDSEKVPLYKRLFGFLRNMCNGLWANLFGMLQDFFVWVATPFRNTYREVGGNWKALWFIWKLLLYKPVTYFGTSCFAIFQTTTFKTSSDHVPMFYVLPMEDEASLTKCFFLASVVLPLFAIFFGGLHCVGWDFTFPSSIEQTIWRVGSVTITVIPVPLFVIYVLHSVLPDEFNPSPTSHEEPKGSHDESKASFTSSKVSPDGSSLSSISSKASPGRWRLAQKIFKSLLIILFDVYLVARLMLLYLAFALLKKQPASAYTAVDWSRFFPHV